MKTKLLFTLAFVLSGCLWPRPAQAYWVSVPVNRTNITTAAPFLRIKALPFHTTNDEVVYFTVMVTSNDKSQVVEGGLQVNDHYTQSGHKCIIANVPVQFREITDRRSMPDEIRPQPAKCTIFHFTVATRYLTDAEFCVNVSVDPKLFSAGTSYCFNLKEFADEK